jgi:hypothetical protein
VLRALGVSWVLRCFREPTHSSQQRADLIKVIKYGCRCNRFVEADRGFNGTSVHFDCCVFGKVDRGF